LFFQICIGYFGSVFYMLAGCPVFNDGLSWLVCGFRAFLFWFADLLFCGLADLGWDAWAALLLCCEAWWWVLFVGCVLVGGICCGLDGWWVLLYRV
jgi:hypothetical protein